MNHLKQLPFAVKCGIIVVLCVLALVLVVRALAPSENRQTDAQSAGQTNTEQAVESPDGVDENAENAETATGDAAAGKTAEIADAAVDEHAAREATESNAAHEAHEATEATEAAESDSAEVGMGGTIEFVETSSNQSATDSKGSTEHSENVDLLGSSANQVNTQQLPDSSFIYDTSIVDLSKADSYYDNQIVQVLGEVVGDRIFATGDTSHCWITLDAANTEVDATIAIYMTTEAASSIDTFGIYGTRGTMLQVRGTYHLACGEHQGVSDIHANYVTVVQPGEELGNTMSFTAFIPGILLLLLGAGLARHYARLREKER